MSSVSGSRRRPLLHLTPTQGWLNDPHAVAQVGGRYHLFYQHNPHAVTWAVGIHWGHAVSGDLVGWVDRGDVLVPDEQDDGCWSGGMALRDGEATLLYTSVQADNPSLGSVRLAHPSPSGSGWTKDPGAPVIGPHAGDLELVDLRDPFPWWDGEQWTVVQGAGVADLGGAVVQYRSPDLRHWRYDGVVVSAATAAAGGAGSPEASRRGDGSSWWGREMWECPQLFPLDGSWVLLLSVGHRHHPGDVVYAVGDYDGHTFTPRSWGPFSHGGPAYAATTFVAAAGRRCAMTWLRERPETVVTEWAGSLSLPMLLALDGDRLVADLHPDLAGYRAGELSAVGGVTVDLLERACEVVQPVPSEGGTAVLRLDDVDGGALVEVTVATDVVRVLAAGEQAIELSRGPQSRRGEGSGVAPPLRLVLDADVLEVCGAGVEGILAVRLPGWPERVSVTGSAGAVVHPLTRQP